MRRLPPLSRPRAQQAANSADALHRPQDGVHVPRPAERSQSPSRPAEVPIANDQAERAQPLGDNVRIPVLAGARADAAEQLGSAAGQAAAGLARAPADVLGGAGDLAPGANPSAVRLAGVP